MLSYHRPDTFEYYEHKKSAIYVLKILIICYLRILV